MTESTLPSWARTVTDTYGTDLRGPVELLADMLVRYDNHETRRAYRLGCSQFLVWMERYHPKTPILAALPAHIDQYEQYLASNHWDAHPGECWDQCKELPYDNPKTRRRKITAVSVFYTYCVGQKRVTSNPVLPKPGRQVTGDAAEENVKDILMPDEISEVMAVAKRAVTGRGVLTVPTLRTAAVFAMFVGCGLRVGELSNARVERLGRRGKSRTLRFKRKNGKWQTIDIGAPTAKILDDYIGARTSGPLIISDGRRTRNKETGELEFTGLNPSSLRTEISRLSAAAGMGDRLFPHLLRHTSVTLALTLPEVTIHRAMVYYGHESTDTTMGYYQHTKLLTPGRHVNLYGINWKTQGLTLTV